VEQPEKERHDMLNVLKRTALTTTVVGGLVLGAVITLPASHAAAATPPTITVTNLSDGSNQLTGSGFTPGGTVDLVVTTPSGYIYARYVTTASPGRPIWYCSPMLRQCWIVGYFGGGTINFTWYISACGNTAPWKILAYDVSTLTFSNYASFYPDYFC
jgi:hypothetical protein